MPHGILSQGRIPHLGDWLNGWPLSTGCDSISGGRHVRDHPPSGSVGSGGVVPPRNGKHQPGNWAQCTWLSSAADTAEPTKIIPTQRVPPQPPPHASAQCAQHLRFRPELRRTDQLPRNQQARQGLDRVSQGAGDNQQGMLRRREPGTHRSHTQKRRSRVRQLPRGMAC
jgi:hypothetical protein